jgi:hypothetical protein
VWDNDWQNAMTNRKTHRNKPEQLPDQKAFRFLAGLAGIISLLLTAGLFWLVNTTCFLTP